MGLIDARRAERPRRVLIRDSLSRRRALMRDVGELFKLDEDLLMRCEWNCVGMDEINRMTHPISGRLVGSNSGGKKIRWIMKRRDAMRGYMYDTSRTSTSRPDATTSGPTSGRQSVRNRSM